MNILEHWLRLTEHQPLTPAFKGVFQHSIQEWLETNPSFQPNPTDLVHFIDALRYLAEKEGPRHSPKIKADPIFDEWSAKVIEWFLQYPSTSSINEYTSIFKEAVSLKSLPVIQAVWKHPNAPKWAELDVKSQKELGIKEIVKEGHLPLMKYLASQGLDWSKTHQMLIHAKDAPTAKFLLNQGCSPTLYADQGKTFSIETYWSNQCRDGRLRQKDFEKMQMVLNEFLSPSKEEEEQAFFKNMWQWSEGTYQRQLRKLNLDQDSDGFRIKAWSGWIKRNSSVERLTKNYLAGQKWAQTHPPKVTDLFEQQALPIPMILNSFNWDNHLLDAYTYHQGSSILPSFGSNLENYDPKEKIDKMIQVLSVCPFMRVSNEWGYAWDVYIRKLSEEDKAYALAQGLEPQALNHVNYLSPPLSRWLNGFKDCSDKALQSQSKIFQEKSSNLFNALFRFISYRNNLPGVTTPFEQGELLIERMHRLHLLPISPLMSLQNSFEDQLMVASSEVKARWLKTYQDYRLPKAKSNPAKLRL